jgi:hypothetical protein
VLKDSPEPGDALGRFDLEFPDWSGKDRQPPRATVTQMHRRRALFAAQLSRFPSAERRLANKIAVEFVL